MLSATRKLLDLPMLLDLAFNWALHLPRDVTLVLVALATVAVVTLVRRHVTDQDRLARCRQDLRQLKQLQREARRNGDREARERMRRTAAAIKRIQLRADLLVLAWSIGPLGLLAWWSTGRLEYLPVRAGDEITLTASYSLSAVERLTHLVPPADCELLTPAIRQVEVDARDPAQGSAQWRLRPGANRPSDLVLTIRHQGHSVDHVVRVGDVTYYAPIVRHPDERITGTEVGHREYRFLGIVPGIPKLGLAPWIVAYLGLSILMMPIVRRSLGIA